jgi:signal peptidase I
MPTIDVGNRFFANRLAYLFDEPQRGDIVVFKHPDGGNVLLVKRVIGLPGEVVMIENGIIFINEQPLENWCGRGGTPADEMELGFEVKV